jgi:hypothetical protein
MLKEIMINLLYIVAILGLIYLGFAIIMTAIEAIQNKIREKKYIKSIEECTEILKEKLKNKECCCKQDKKKKDTKKN